MEHTASRRQFLTAAGAAAAATLGAHAAQPPETSPPPDDAAQRWDGSSVHAFSGTYGEYLLNKVGKVFPQLGQAVLPGG